MAAQALGLLPSCSACTRVRFLSLPHSPSLVDGRSVDGERWLWVGVVDAALRSTGRKHAYGWAVPIDERFDLSKECVVGCLRFSPPEERYCGLSLLLRAPGFPAISQGMHDRSIASGVFRDDCQQLQEADPASPPILVGIPRAESRARGCGVVFVWNRHVSPPFSRCAFFPR
jgi:hypothetical protein